VTERYRLTRAAEADLITIYREGARLFGTAQAERYHAELGTIFDLLARHPEMARERLELTPPMRLHPHKAHLILYRVEADRSVLIVRLRHAREDWVEYPD
jgi:toxin ParE1/3/4